MRHEHGAFPPQPIAPERSIPSRVVAGACIAGGFGWTGKDWGGVVNMLILDFEFAPQFAAVDDSQTRKRSQRNPRAHSYASASANARAIACDTGFGCSGRSSGSGRQPPARGVVLAGVEIVEHAHSDLAGTVPAPVQGYSRVIKGLQSLEGTRGSASRPAQSRWPRRV